MKTDSQLQQDVITERRRHPAAQQISGAHAPAIEVDAKLPNVNKRTDAGIAVTF